MELGGYTLEHILLVNTMNGNIALQTYQGM